MNASAGMAGMTAVRRVILMDSGLTGKGRPSSPTFDDGLPQLGACGVRAGAEGHLEHPLVEPPDSEARSAPAHLRDVVALRDDASPQHPIVGDQPRPVMPAMRRTLVMEVDHHR